MGTNGNLYWKELPTSVQEQFLKSAQSIEFKRGDVIYAPGDSPEGIYFIKKGLVGLVILGLSGKEHLLRFFREDQFFGHRTLFSEEKYHASTIA